MSGENNLEHLLKNLKPVLHPGKYVFTSQSSDKSVPIESVIGTFTEKEGTTLILSLENAVKLGMNYEFVAAWITLEVHSSLEAIGLTAVFSNALTSHQISCNVIAGFYHDHLFVDYTDGPKAVKILKELSKNR
ncbi:ACT domain-containing protein [Euzebyella marina]|uniref:ACT domain-containing protein n=1 Tax=Euzebyella marina TaxID=1761453 RepID=A0A3G2L9T5_9FLAO|nr:ACT domain-containing protein [Euzebyella marina]AYN68971.1 ACT domain-containing protein [Euzebyella marina]